MTAPRVEFTTTMPQVSVQHRCPRMIQHVDPALRLPVPCDQCYSVVITSVRVPWRPEEPWHDVA